MLDSWAWMPCLVEQHVDYQRLLYDQFPLGSATSGKGDIKNYTGICIIVATLGVADGHVQGGMVGDLSFMCPTFIQDGGGSGYGGGDMVTVVVLVAALVVVVVAIIECWLRRCGGGNNGGNSSGRMVKGD
ncbi:hypothetical protein HYC85_012290 [Camellia sinensis]|uniref:Uncharacterized protein n=1 Tax=Camellia sinensis TaxID=4442 RepID=A0A7J7HCS9_CAMSI|nr:hypothetical protein HYC85_012290 [Camellia sinensis]